MGRYIQSDPIGIAKDYSDPQIQLALQHQISRVAGSRSLSVLSKANSHKGSFDLNHSYGYAEQNPIVNTDPSGLASVNKPKGGGARTIRAPCDDFDYASCAASCQKEGGVKTCNSLYKITTDYISFEGTKLSSEKTTHVGKECSCWGDDDDDDGDGGGSCRKPFWK